MVGNKPRVCSIIGIGSGKKMTEKKRNKAKSARQIEGFSKETAKLRYENLQNDKAEAPAEAFEDMEYNKKFGK